MDEVNEFVIVGSFPQPLEAQFFQTLLDAEGIESHLDGEYTLGANPLWSNAIGGVKLAVAPENAEQARRLLEDYRREKDASATQKNRICPRCQSTEVTAVTWPTFIKILVVATLGIFSLFCTWKKSACTQCGNKW